MQRINKLIQSRPLLSSSIVISSGSYRPSLTPIHRCDAAASSHSAHAVQQFMCANRTISTSNTHGTVSLSKQHLNSTITTISALVRPFSTSSSSPSSSTPPPAPVSATPSYDKTSDGSSLSQPLRLAFLAVIAVLAFDQAREVFDPEYAAERKKNPSRLQVISKAVVDANERYEIDRAVRLALKQQGQQQDKHIKGERKSGSLVQSPEASPAPITSAVVPTAAAAATPVSETKSAAASAAASNDPYDPECRVCRSGGEQTDINAFYRNQSQIASAASNAASDFALNSSGSSAPSPSCPPCYAYSHSLCPLNRAEVGRAAWGYLHTIAAYYPASPSQRQQNEMAQFLHLFMKLYPCGYCADRSMEQLEREPIENFVSSQEALSGWMCRLHNEVNERLGKPIFQCEYSNARWRDGPPTGECD